MNRITCPHCLKDFDLKPGQLPELHCHRCNHTWNPRAGERPKICPQCKSRYWFLPPKRVPAPLPGERTA